MIFLERFGYPPWGTYGRIMGPDFEFATVERPWLGNKPWVSCIPEGEYELTLGRFNRGGYPAWEFSEVPGRSYIKIHRANLPRQLHGCIGIGTDFGAVRLRPTDPWEWGVLNSRVGFETFMVAMEKAFDGCPVTLTIRSHPQALVG